MNNIRHLTESEMKYFTPKKGEKLNVLVKQKGHWDEEIETIIKDVVSIEISNICGTKYLDFYNSDGKGKGCTYNDIVAIGYYHDTGAGLGELFAIWEK